MVEAASGNTPLVFVDFVGKIKADVERAVHTCSELAETSVDAVCDVDCRGSIEHIIVAYGYCLSGAGSTESVEVADVDSTATGSVLGLVNGCPSTGLMVD